MRALSRLYAEAGPEDQFALRVWMRDIILGRIAAAIRAPAKKRVTQSFQESLTPQRPLHG